MGEILGLWVKSIFLYHRIPTYREDFLFLWRPLKNETGYVRITESSYLPVKLDTYQHQILSNDKPSTP